MAMAPGDVSALITVVTALNFLLRQNLDNAIQSPWFL